MKKIISIILFLVVISLAVFSIFNKEKNKENNLTKITVSEVAHSIFYAPQYVAISEGFFEDEGIDIELVLTPGADAVMASLLSNDSDIGLAGTEGTIYIYNGGEKNYPRTFAGLTAKDGSFLVAREEIKNFTLEDLKGKTVIGGRKGHRMVNL